MQLKENCNLIHFLTQVKKCSSEVYFETSEGDSLALRSALSQYIFCSLAGQPALLQSGNIRLENPDDTALLAEYLK